MTDLLKNIQTTIEEFKTDSTQQLEKGNKAAGTRARKSALELSKMMKEFRKVSVSFAKGE